MKKLFYLIAVFIALPGYSADSLHYSGRLVNTNGSPIAGPRELEFTLYGGTNAICTLPKSTVPLQNGVFNVDLDFNGDTGSTCAGNYIAGVGSAIAAGNSLFIEVTDVNGAVTYPKQLIMVPPLSMFTKNVAAGGVSNTSLLGVLANCTLGQVIKTNGTGGFVCENSSTTAAPSGNAGGDLAGTYPDPTIRDGSVTTDDLAALAVTAPKIANGTITSAKLNQMGAAPGQFLSWTGAIWAPVTPASETDPTVLGFAKYLPEACSDSQILRFDALLNSGAGGLYCQTYTTDNITEGTSKLFFTNVRARTAAVGDTIINGVTTIAPSQNAVFDALATKADISNSSSNNTSNTTTVANSIRFLEDSANGTNYVGLEGPPSIAANFLWTLPAADGTSGLVFTTNGAGQISWTQVSTAGIADSAVTTAKIVDGTIINADLADGSVDSAKVLNGTLITEDFADSSVTSAKVSDGTLVTADLADSSVTSSKIVDATITGADINILSNVAVNTVALSSELRMNEDPLNGINYVGLKSPANVAANFIWTLPAADGSGGYILTTNGAGVLTWAQTTSAGIADSSVTSAKIADGTIATIDLADSSVTSAKIADSTIISADITDGTIASADIADGTLITADLANSSVNSAKILDDSIIGADISSTANLAVNTVALSSELRLNEDIANGVNYVGLKSPLNVAADLVWTLPAADGAVGFILTTNGAGVLSWAQTSSAGIADSSVTSAKIADGAIATIDLADGSVTSAKIADGTIVSGDITDGTIASIDITDGTIVTADLADTSVTTAKIVDGTIIGSDINTTANVTVNTVALSSELRLNEDPINGVNYVGLKSPLGVAANLVWTLPAADGAGGYILTTNGAGVLSWAQTSSAGIADSSVTSAKIADGTIGTLDLADGAVTSAKIADGSIISGDITDGTIASIDIADGTIASADIADGTIASIDIADGAIASADIADGTITSIDIADGTVSSTDILDLTIVDGDIANSTITGGKIAGQTITNTHLSGMTANCASGETLKTNGLGAFYCAAGYSGSGTTGYLPRWTGTFSLGNSTISDNGSLISLGSAVDASGGSGTSYITAPIEIVTTATPRISFHWPGVVASQIGMDSSGVVRTYDNPGTGYENFAAKNITANGALSVTGNASVTGTVTAAGFSGPLTGNVTGNASTATNVAYTGITGKPTWTGWSTVSQDFVAGLLGWKHYGNNHVIFDASNSTSPNGSAVNNTNAAVAWTATYPTLMGWNGSSTYGVRVDSARTADSVSGPQPYYNVTPGDGYGLRFWNSDSYKISMGVGGLYQYGPVTDYSIKMQMDAGSPGRGFTWGREGVAPIAALNSTTGSMTIAGNFTAASFLYSSDKRLKKNVITIEHPLEKITSLRGVNFSWIKDGGKDIGFIAQEVEKVEPRLVETGKDGFKSVKYGNIVAIVVEAIKEIKETLNANKSESDQIKREMATLKRENELLKKHLEAQDLRLRKQDEKISELAESGKK